ncbi:MAG TPA: hypothetical protein VFY92_08035 [Hyphomicrobiaceae bacterium]|nr:hypothetical protein [Hyphomicrobiaceae bacterium]
MRKLLLLGCAVLGLVMVSAISNPADARRGHGFHGGGHHSGGRHFSHPSYHGHHSYHRHYSHRGHRRHRGIFIGAPFYYGYGYYGSCSWLRRKALRTGSRYWWNRYEACLYDY